MRKAQRRMLEIAVEVARICDEHGIPYWINGGTLLGAVRHGGFIPWDDDFDIEVLEKDYAPLLNILERELLRILLYIPVTMIRICPVFLEK